VSIPRPPEIESARLKVEAAVGEPSPPVTAKVIDPLNVSFPAVLVVPASPLRLAPSLPVVSDLFCTQNGVNTHLVYLYFDIRPDIDSITTIDHQ
jgi:hypothetical protein